jgi:hypothetical protein
MQTKVQYLLGCLAEECAELGQRAIKAQRFGIEEKEPGQDKTNLERLTGEWNDLAGVVTVLHREGVSLENSPGAVFAKMDKIRKYFSYSQELGMVG